MRQPSNLPPGVTDAAVERQATGDAPAHTPGPWKVVYCSERSTIPIVDRAGRSVCTLRNNVAGVLNAPLVAAAPGMLELLQELVDIEGPQPGHIEWANRVKAAIAEATGA